MHAERGVSARFVGQGAREPMFAKHVPVKRAVHATPDPFDCSQVRGAVGYDVSNKDKSKVVQMSRANARMLLGVYMQVALKNATHTNRHTHTVPGRI